MDLKNIKDVDQEKIRRLPKPNLIEEDCYYDSHHFNFLLQMKENKCSKEIMMSTPSGRVTIPERQHLRREDITSDMLVSKEDSEKYWEEVKKRVSEDDNKSIYSDLLKRVNDEWIKRS